MVASSTPASLSPLPVAQSAKAQRAKAQEPCAACYMGVGSLNLDSHAFGKQSCLLTHVQCSTLVSNLETSTLQKVDRATVEN